ncbi:ribonuclease [Pseudomonas sp. 31-12]|uniref:ribonuclease T2 family protein n=1 Tax=Pseudomonas sp. 31-12 TaxID=2201356 RepID=UPI000D6BF154|nr:ribonuclease [Pseudomonas sp. 31-12]AWM90819.1 ribonuclease [Pseudomonas sp. 31-12]
MNRLYASMALSVFSLCAHALDPSEESKEGAPSAHFDYLAYAITWQPTFCMLKPTTAGCDKPKNVFYTHGIWPYYKSTDQSANRHPSSCIKSVGCGQAEEVCELSDTDQKLAEAEHGFSEIVTESPDYLMKHEWKKHGTCYGTNQTEYFRDFVKLRKAVNYSPDFNQFQGESLDLNQLKALFPSNTSFRCASQGGKQHLFEVFFLIDRQGQPYTEDQKLQIGEKCQSREIHIPKA